MFTGDSVYYPQYRRNKMNEGVKASLSYNDQAVIKHMEMLQSIISRMAGNSADCKKWFIPFVMAVMAYLVKNEQLSLANVAQVIIIPALLFYFVDTYYLKLENEFRNKFNADAGLIQQKKFTQKMLFNFAPKGNEWNKAFTSLSTWPIYLGMLGFIAIIRFFVGGT